MKDTIILGNATTAHILHTYLRADDRFRVTAFSAHEKYIKEKQICGLEVIPFESLSTRIDPGKTQVILGMGYANLNRDREKMFGEAEALGFEIVTYVHREAQVFSRAIGKGSIVLPGAVVEPFAEIEENSMIWCNVVVAHHSRVGKNCWLASNCVISGETKIGRNSFLGVNATVVNKVVVGEYNIVGAHALIAKDTKDGSVYLAKSAEKLDLTSEQYLRFSHF